MPHFCLIPTWLYARQQILLQLGVVSLHPKRRQHRQSIAITHNKLGKRGFISLYKYIFLHICQCMSHWDCFTYLCLGKMNDNENYCWMLRSTRWESMQPGNGGFKYSRFLTDPKVYILKDACHRVSMCNYMNTFFFNRWMRMQKESSISNLVPMGQMGT